MNTKSDFSPDSIYISVLKLDERLGPKIFVSEDLPFNPDDFLIKTSVFYNKKEGMYGPLPAQGDFQALIYAKSLPDILQQKMKSKGVSHVLIVVFIHSQFQKLFEQNELSEEYFKSILESIDDISEINASFIANLKQKVYESLLSTSK